MDHRRAAGCRQYAEKLDGTIEECISVLTYLTEIVLFLMKTFVGRIIPVDTNRNIKVPYIDFG